MIIFSKYHGLGNDYLVINPKNLSKDLTPEQIKLICHRNFGIGSDGILLGPIETLECKFGLRIFNPDGSEAEKSGNGLRIFSRYLWDKGLVKEKPFSIMTHGGEVISRVHAEGKLVDVEMGKVNFQSQDIPVLGPAREVINETMLINNREMVFCAVTIGNPHCVFLLDEISEATAKEWGPYVENDKRFPNRTNVQFMKILDRHNIQIEIWERGAGYTLASGSSSCASAAVAYRLDHCDSEINVHMVGGTLKITVQKNYEISMTGPVVQVCDGRISNELFETKK